jgi:hypothetical protein
MGKCAHSRIFDRSIDGVERRRGGLEPRSLALGLVVEPVEVGAVFERHVVVRPKARICGEKGRVSYWRTRTELEET